MARYLGRNPYLIQDEAAAPAPRGFAALAVPSTPDSPGTQEILAALARLRARYPDLPPAPPLPLPRPTLSFRAVNRPGAADYDPGLQRHHLVPTEMLADKALARMFYWLGIDSVGYDDFRRNGLLLPSNDAMARRLGLPLHRGPHPIYNDVVRSRVGQIEARWSRNRRRFEEEAGEEALFRLGLLQRALRRRLLNPRGRPMTLSSRDPVLVPVDFADLDAMAESLWGETE